jgi:hypothetical protein
MEGLEVRSCGTPGTVNVWPLLPLYPPRWQDADGFTLMAAAWFSLLHSLLASSAWVLLFLILPGPLTAK